MEEEMDLKYIRIAELVEQTEKLTELILLHKQGSNQVSTIRQYELKRNELISELQELLTPARLVVGTSLAS